jgi:hypothetical protein
MRLDHKVYLPTYGGWPFFTEMVAGARPETIQPSWNPKMKCVTVSLITGTDGFLCEANANQENS